MPRLRCPRCAALVDVPAGTHASCPWCGFSGRTPAPAAAAPVPRPARLAPAAARVPPAAPAPAPRAPLAAPARPAPAAPPKRNAGLAVALVAVALLAVAAAGAAAWMLLRHDAADLPTESEARALVAEGLDEARQAAAGNASRPDLRTVALDVRPASGDGAESYRGSDRLRVTLEWGEGGALRVDGQAERGPFSEKGTRLCVGDRLYVLVGEESYVSRPYVEGRPDCVRFSYVGLDVDPAREFAESVPPSVTNVTVGQDGSVHGTLAGRGGRIDVGIDPQGRLSTLVLDDPTLGNWTASFAYGERRALELPADPDPLPATVDIDMGFGGFTASGLPDRGLHTWEVKSSPQRPPRADIEFRVTLGHGGFMSLTGDHPDAAFDCALDEPQTQGNLTFRYRDNDHDGKVSAGDGLEVRDLSQNSTPPDASDGQPHLMTSFFPIQATLYDKAAGRDTNWSPAGVPAPSWLALAALALGLAALRRR